MALGRKLIFGPSPVAGPRAMRPRRHKRWNKKHLCLFWCFTLVTQRSAQFIEAWRNKLSRPLSKVFDCVPVFKAWQAYNDRDENVKIEAGRLAELLGVYLGRHGSI